MREKESCNVSRKEALLDQLLTSVDQRFGELTNATWREELAREMAQNYFDAFNEHPERRPHRTFEDVMDQYMRWLKTLSREDYEKYLEDLQPVLEELKQAVIYRCELGAEEERSKQAQSANEIRCV